MHITGHQHNPPRGLPSRPPQPLEQNTWTDSVYAGGEHTNLGIRLNTAVFTPLMFVPVVGAAALMVAAREVHARF